jgi:hypothetical protein
MDDGQATRFDMASSESAAFVYRGYGHRTQRNEGSGGARYAAARASYASTLLGYRPSKWGRNTELRYVNATARQVDMNVG